MTFGSSADTAWTFSGGVAAPAVGESTADDTVVQSVDSSTEEDKARPSSSAAPKVAPKAKNLSRTSTPSRPTSSGSRTTKGNDRKNEAPSLPVMQALRLVAKGKDKGSRTPDRVSKPSSSRSSSSKRSRSSTKVRDKSQPVIGRRRRILSAETESQPTLRALTNSEEATMETIPAIEDTSPIRFPSPANDTPMTHQTNHQRSA